MQKYSTNTKNAISGHQENEYKNKKKTPGAEVKLNNIP